MTRALSLIVTALFVCASPAGAQRLSVHLHDGLADVDAQDVPLRQILDEWARVGNVAVSNADKTATVPVTLTLTNVPEKSALATLLRDVSGYMLAPRAGGTGASSFSRILILPTSGSSPPAAAAARTAAPPLARRVFPRAPDLGAPQAIDDDAARARDAEIEALRERARATRGQLPTPPEARRVGSRTELPPAAAATLPTPPPGPATTGPTAAAGSTSTLGSPIGSAQPGVITPAPPPPPASRPRQAGPAR
jgi:hypothetical protein